MSEPKEKVDISDLKDTFLECPVCVEHFNQIDRRPRLLHSCLHAFCTQCLQQLLEKEGKGQITCPLCRQIQTVTGDVDSLPMDPVRDQLVEYLQITHKQKVQCKDCPDENSAKSRCMDCGENLCQNCEYVHRRHRSTRGHRILPLEDVDKEPRGTLKIKHFCATHADRVIECYCENCEVLCCLLCVVIDHKGHDFKQVEDAANMKIKEIESSMIDVDEVSDKLKTAKLDCETYIRDIQNDKEKLLSEINSKFDTAEQLLRERRLLLIKEVEDSSERLAEVAEKSATLYDSTLTDIRSTQTYFSNAKSKTDGVSLLQTYPSLKKNITTIKQYQNKSILKWNEKVTFQAVEEANVQRHIGNFGVVKSIKTDQEPQLGLLHPQPVPSPSCEKKIHVKFDDTIERDSPLSVFGEPQKSPKREETYEIDEDYNEVPVFNDDDLTLLYTFSDHQEQTTEATVDMSKPAVMQTNGKFQESQIELKSQQYEQTTEATVDMSKPAVMQTNGKFQESQIELKSQQYASQAPLTPHPSLSYIPTSQEPSVYGSMFINPYSQTGSIPDGISMQHPFSTQRKSKKPFVIGQASQAPFTPHPSLSYIPTSQEPSVYGSMFINPYSQTGSIPDGISMQHPFSTQRKSKKFPP